jgi:hypothetical protein
VDPEVALVIRRLFGSLVVLACLLGILQPAIACVAACAADKDCCPAGSLAGSGEQVHQLSLSAQLSSCCELRLAIATSVSAIGGRTEQGHGSGSSAAIALPTAIRVGRPPQELRAPAAQIPHPFDESLTYLRTARLRL